MEMHTWTIAELRCRYIIWDEEYSVQLRSAYPDSAVVTADEVLHNPVFPPRVRFSLATKLPGVGGKQFKRFSLDCVVYLVSLLEVDTPGYEEILDCIAQLRAYIDHPTKQCAQEVRRITGKLELATYPKSGTLFWERSVRDSGAHILGIVGRFSGRIQREGPQKYEPFAPRACAGLAGTSAADAIGDCRVRLAASQAAVKSCLQGEETGEIPANLRPILAAWAGEHCSIMVDQYRRTRLPYWTAFESFDFAHYIAEQNEFDLKDFLSCVPFQSIEAVQRAIVEAQKAAYRAYAQAEINAENEAMAFLAERMTEYVYGNPEPWDINNLPANIVF